MDRHHRQHQARRGVFPGSFNPLTIAHLAIVRQARAEHDLDEVDLVVSAVALDKPTPPGPPLDKRISLIEDDLANEPWLSVTTTDLQLIVDIAEGYDVVIMGADKWQQVNDVRYYGSSAERDDAVARLPQVVVAPRTGNAAPEELRLDTAPDLHDVSSTEARAGDRSIMAPSAATGWSHAPTVRRMRADEVSLAATIYIESRKAAAIPPSIHSEESMRRWFATHLIAEADVWFAEVGEKTVGVMALSNGWIEQLYVLEEYTRQGAGAALVEHAKTLQERLDLWTFQSNLDAQRFYERHGFIEIARTDGDNEESAPAVRYRWKSSRGTL
jgi:GNAT superfamily N-acetyltransferase